MMTAVDDVVRICQDLLRIDTTNTGDLETSAGERVAAEYVAEQLAEVGIESQLRESAPGRANLVARIPGTDSGRGALLVHGHLDVVPPTSGNGRSTRSPVSCATATSGVAARST